ncbi:MAG: site-specific DNA-methyltransferase [Caldilineaceae bacterium SB0661_bin_32]|uniref:Site-specific DNA-methyltransferase n=1 Tax=Caldilineaceae bacterium SB0661_bin_32 TaxID=2605255 RepID=A0A6B1D5Z4_9CHLR|nr:site-specific DNA-methyltransferase [Caldilineaceae bacterium SB0661_bin_32]
MPKQKKKKTVDTIRHEDATRKNLPSAEHQPLMQEEDQSPLRVAYERRNRDLDPQLVWRGKDEQDWSDLVVNVPPLYIQERVHPKVLVDDLMHQSEQARRAQENNIQPGFADLFADFNGLPSEDAKTEFYQHDANWSNRMVLGDSLQVMASLAEREGLRGKVQCIYIDPPYGIKFNSNFQWSTTSRVVRDGKADHITREPEQVKAFRDTWRDGIHSYLTYLRDRLTVARDLLAESGSIFVQIGDENVHLVRALMDEVFGSENYVTSISFFKTGAQTSSILPQNSDTILWYSSVRERIKTRRLFNADGGWVARATSRWSRSGEGIFSRASDEPTSSWTHRALESNTGSEASRFPVFFNGNTFAPKRGWSTSPVGMLRLTKAHRVLQVRSNIRYAASAEDFPFSYFTSTWVDTGTGSFGDQQVYVVQTTGKVIQRCILMTTDPGDLVLDPTCGSGTTAYVAEQWGRRWITIDTSRVALALARARIMGARYPYYLLADSRAGQQKEAEVERKAPSESPRYGDIRQGFVYERVPHITLRAIANNAEIDVIWEDFQQTLEPLREGLNTALGTNWEEWEIPREAEEEWPPDAKKLHDGWCQQRIARQKEIDASIATKADKEFLYDKPHEDRTKVRVAGPFTVESISPHRVLAVDENDEFIETFGEEQAGYGSVYDFAAIILENLRTAGVQQAHKEDRIDFTSLTPWPGHHVCAEGRFFEGGEESGIQRRAAIFIGPEFGTVSRPDLVDAAREAADGAFDLLIACAFNYEAHTSEFEKLGKIPVLKARMNADLHMAADLKNTGKGNLFVIFGEPDVELLDAEDNQITVRVNGVDVLHPNTGEVRSDGPDGIACWFVDTDYNGESFFVRHAYFLGANDPYKALKTTLKAEIDTEAWASLHSDTSRPFNKPDSGRIAVKVINHLGDEVMKIFRVE